jgi:hypothetical protein
MLDAWARRTLGELQFRFDVYADRYRAHLDRLASGDRTLEAEQTSIERDLNLLYSHGSD